MQSQQAALEKRTRLAAIGLTMIGVSLLIVVSLVRSPHVLSKPLHQESTPTSVENSGVDATDLQQGAQQPIIVNGRAVYAVPIISGPEATAILQNVQVSDIAYVVHSFPGWGDAVSTAVGWFRCADIVNPTQYLGSQLEVEAWFFLTEQERLEVQAACML